VIKLDKLVDSKLGSVVAVEPDSDGASVFIRDNDKVEVKKIPFRPYLLVEKAELFENSDIVCEITPLNGNAPLKNLVRFSSVTDYEAALQHLKKITGRSYSAPGAPYKVVVDRTCQILSSESIRCFRGMEFPQLRRLQFDLETITAGDYDFPNPQRAGDEIIIISLSDSTGWEMVLSQRDCSEKELLEKFVEVVQERDPDVLEGHNIYRFDLPYLETRAKRHKVKLALGRDGSTFKKRSSRFSAAERSVNYTRYDVYGRHVIDTFILAVLYDVSHRSLESYGLKSIARHFGVAASDRTYVEGSKITECWHNDPDKLLAYALDDVRETRSISAILSPSYFYQAQLVPMKYQDCVARGNATRIDALFAAEYLTNLESLPWPGEARRFEGGLTRAFHSGVFENVWHCDIRSLYPSVILADGISPERDSLGVFRRLLDELRQFRLSAKDAEKKAANSEEKDYYNSLQTTFKVLINSFYGYLGFSQGTFNDFNAAEQVTARGREILTMMLDFLEKRGANVIEMDTDGIYFQPPADAPATEGLEREIQTALPQGIEVELDSVYKAMFCYKSKNYALLGENGEISIAGAALKSRGLEPFQREYIEKTIAMLLTGRAGEIEDLYYSFRGDIEHRRWPLGKLAKTETLADSPEAYRRKQETGKSRRSAAYELVLGSSRDYRRGDQVAFYLIGDKRKASVVDNSRLLHDAPERRDENIPYYLNKLEELHKKFAEFIPADMIQDTLF
jgi:DNA polymerase, archaea type